MATVDEMGHIVNRTGIFQIFSIRYKIKIAYIPKNDLVVTRTIKILEDRHYSFLKVEFPIGNFRNVILKALKF